MASKFEKDPVYFFLKIRVMIHDADFKRELYKLINEEADHILMLSNERKGCLPASRDIMA
jgi:hypothetical protein